MKVFISHSSSDKAVAKQVADGLTAEGSEVWFDTLEIGAGDSLVERIQKGIADADILVVLFSSASLKSGWVQAEINAFFNRAMYERNVRIIPVLVEKVEIPALLKDRLYVDLTQNFDEGLRAIVEAAVDTRDPCRSLPPSVWIDSFDAGVPRPNLLGGNTLFYQENGDPESFRGIFCDRGGGRSLRMAFDFSQRGPRHMPPRFVGYATRLQLADWTRFATCDYSLSMDARSDGITKEFQLEIKRLIQPRREESRQEIAKWTVDVSEDWQVRSLRLQAIVLPNVGWDNMWEICFVLFRDRAIGDRGFIELDNLRLTKAQS